MRITAKQLRAVGCCQSGINTYFNNINRKQWDAEKLIKYALEHGGCDDACVALSKLMTKRQRVGWAVYCAEQVIHIYVSKYPDDDRPSKALAAAKKYLKTPTKQNASAAWAASNAAWAAASDAASAAASYAASAARAAARAASAAWAASNAAWDAASAASNAARDAASAASNAARDAASTARAAAPKLKAKLLKKGLAILEGKR